MIILSNSVSVHAPYIAYSAPVWSHTQSRVHTIVQLDIVYTLIKLDTNQAAIIASYCSIVIVTTWHY